MQLHRRGFLGTVIAGFAALAVGRLPKLLKKETVVHLDWFRFMLLKGESVASAECRWRIDGKAWQRKGVKLTKRQPRFYLADNVWIDFSPQFDKVSPRLTTVNVPENMTVNFWG